jgi:hypothetical protein
LCTSTLRRGCRPLRLLRLLRLRHLLRRCRLLRLRRLLRRCQLPMLCLLLHCLLWLLWFRLRRTYLLC